MSDKNRKPCIRCLIRELDEEEAWEQIKKYRCCVPVSRQTSLTEYENRLSICKDCKWLHRGTCRKCGAYVEARAFDQKNHCPLGERIW